MSANSTSLPNTTNAYKQHLINQILMFSVYNLPVSDLHPSTWYHQQSEEQLLQIVSNHNIPIPPMPTNSSTNATKNDLINSILGHFGGEGPPAQQRRQKLNNLPKDQLVAILYRQNNGLTVSPNNGQFRRNTEDEWVWVLNSDFPDNRVPVWWVVGANLTIPNSTIPNSTIPNSTIPNSTIPNNTNSAEQQRVIAGKTKQIARLVVQANKNTQKLKDAHTKVEQLKGDLHDLLATCEDLTQSNQVSEGANLQIANLLLKIHNKANQISNATNTN